MRLDGAVSKGDATRRAPPWKGASGIWPKGQDGSGSLVSAGWLCDAIRQGRRAIVPGEEARHARQLPPGRHFFADSRTDQFVRCPCWKAIARSDIRTIAGRNQAPRAGRCSKASAPIFGTCEPVHNLSRLGYRRLGKPPWSTRSRRAIMSLMFRGTGWFAKPCGGKLAERLGLKAEILPGDWRGGVRCGGDSRRGCGANCDHAIKAVCVVQ